MRRTLALLCLALLLLAGCGRQTVPGRLKLGYVVTESNPVAGSDTYVGIDNREAGRKAGRW
ncbi:MAG: hypothetical protein AB1505_23970 [Candidatus Latescibacterota bacterium]